MTYFKRAFHRSGFWFLCFALIASLPWLFFIPSVLLSTSNYLSGDTSVTIKDVLVIIALPIAPIVSAYFFGGFIGSPIILKPELSILNCRIRGVIISGGALFTFIIINLIEIGFHDYSNSIETSAERSFSIASGISLFMAPFVLLLGSWAGGWLKTYVSKRANGV